ncbi:DnaT-like ssDNA-binding protein [Methylopila sp. 73B]|uniref:DnaT-like ssDNA-binding protein n=1 Tax=Methylopila sp. 73B TaxID=1120792 RepID=UPI00036753ED|nr:DnaT-like ssDNA-binding protein [Methylopila sp. 73B]
MALLVGTDTYATLAEADAYLSSRGVSAWDGAYPPAKEAALIEATAFLDAAFAWAGKIEDTAQALSWPRICVKDREGRTLSGIPVAVKNAAIELAALAVGGRLSAMALQDNGGAIKSEEIGDVRVQYDTATIRPANFDYVEMLLRGLGTLRSKTNATVKLQRV